MNFAPGMHPKILIPVSYSLFKKCLCSYILCIDRKSWRGPKIAEWLVQHTRGQSSPWSCMAPKNWGSKIELHLEGWIVVLERVLLPRTWDGYWHLELTFSLFAKGHWVGHVLLLWDLYNMRESHMLQAGYFSKNQLQNWTGRSLSWLVIGCTTDCTPCD